MDDFTVDIDAGLYNTDLDDIGWDPVKVDDSDNESAEMFGY